MNGLQLFGAVAALVTTAIGATWALRSKLADIESAIREHISRDEETHAAQDARIIKLEVRRGRR